MVRRSSRLEARRALLPLSRAVWALGELVRIIVFFADWPTLMAIARTSRVCRNAAKSEVQYRLSFALRPFISPTLLPDFFSEMSDSGIAIVGSIPLHVLQINRPWYAAYMASWWSLDFPLPTTSLDLNILVPHAQWGRIVRWFLIHGYRHPVNFPVAHCYRIAGVKQFVGFFLPPSYQNAFLDGVCLVRVTLSQCTRSVVQTAFSAPFSTQTNIVTAHAVISPFPAMSFDPSCARNGVHPFQSPSVRLPASFDWEPTNEHWPAPCGQRCPILIRNQPNRRRPAVFEWRVASGEASHIHTTHQTQATASRLPGHYRGRCYNPHCPNRSPLLVDTWHPRLRLL
ncbi:hypothetical protein NMY22_g19484 [Coprinellus aureogranulatus]|nr:hypothetical protein NMY22_g19484 [Coprinellus aureogranulatus]